MDNRESNKMKSTTSDSDVNRNTSSRSGKDKSDSAGFGQNINKPENLNDEPNSRSSSSGDRH